MRDLLKESLGLIVGKNAEDLVDFFGSDKFVNEFLLSKKMGLTINQVRNLLYKISEQGLLTFNRKKDVKKGWYTYYWKLEIFKTLAFLKNYLEKRSEQVKFQIENREKKQYYLCERCNTEFNEENALLHNFMCDECGGIFILKDNTKLLKELKKNFDKFQERINEINKQMDIERIKMDKIKEKEIKKLEKEVERKKREKKEARLALKNKESGKKRKDSSSEKKGKESNKKKKEKVESVIKEPKTITRKVRAKKVK